MKKSRLKAGKWRKCPDCGAEIYHHCVACAVRSSKPRQWKCQICEQQCTKHHYQRFCTTCFENPKNAVAVEEARQERHRRFRQHETEREPTLIELEKLIASRLASMPIGDGTVKLLDRRDGRALIPPRPRKRTRWGDQDVLTPLLGRTTGGFSRALLMADEWLQKQDPGLIQPIRARSRRNGQIVTIEYRECGKRKIQIQQFATEDCLRQDKTRERRAEGKRNSPIYHSITGIWKGKKKAVAHG